MSVKSEEFIEQGSHSGVDNTDIPEKSIGHRLKTARIALGLSQAEVANELKLKVSIIRCLDEDDTSTTLSPTFKNGYIRAYAKRVGVDGNLFLTSSNSAPTTEPLTAKMQSFSRKVERQNSDKRINLVTLLIISSSIISLVTWWYQQSNEASDNSTYLQELVEDNTLPDDNSIRITPEVEASNPDKEPALGELNVVDEVVEPVLSDNFTSAESSSNSVVEVAAPTQYEDQTNTNDDTLVSVRLTFSGDCWMQLTDANGEPIAYGTKTAGRVVDVVGYPPFELILGEPKAVAIEYAGQPFAMANHRPGKTARITLPTL